MAGSAVVIIPCGPASIMAVLGQSEATLSAIAIRACASGPTEVINDTGHYGGKSRPPQT